MAIEDDGVLEASDILTCVVRRYTTTIKDELISLAPTHVPLVVEQLCQLGQYETLLNYLKVAYRTRTLGTQYAEIFSMACLGDKLPDLFKSAFTLKVSQLIARSL